MVKRRLSRGFYLISVFVTVIIMIGGIYFGTVLSREKVSDLERYLDEMKRSGDEISIELALATSFENSSCKILSYEIGKSASDAEKLGNKVKFYESTEKLIQPGFFSLKREYTNTLVKLWLFLEKIKQSCNATGFVTNLYFFSNKDCGQCPEQGVILDYLKISHPQNVMTFAIDSDLDSRLVDLLKNIYKVEKTPTLIINGKKYDRLVTLAELKEILCSDANVCS